MPDPILAVIVILRQKSSNIVIPKTALISFNVVIETDPVVAFIRNVVHPTTDKGIVILDVILT